MLHNNRLVDAVVLQWLGGTDLEEGSKHMVNGAPGAPARASGVALSQLL